MTSSTIHSVYGALAEQGPLRDSAFWAEGSLYTYADIHKELMAQSSIGVDYATAVLTSTLEFIGRLRPTDKRDIAADIRIDVTPRQCAIEQYKSMPQDAIAWTTMSQNYTVSRMIGLLENCDEDGLTFITSMMFVARDHIGRQAEARAQAIPKDGPYLF